MTAITNPTQRSACCYACVCIYHIASHFGRHFVAWLIVSFACNAKEPCLVTSSTGGLCYSLTQNPETIAVAPLPPYVQLPGTQ